jgi:hypothetical protein
MKKGVFIVIVICSMISACMNRSEPFTEKKIIVASKQTVEIPEIDLSITNNGCGRKWVTEKDRPAFERAYCDLVIQRDKTIIHAGNDSKPVYIGDLQIYIERMNPWGREEDSVPPGGCRLWIRRTGRK